MWRDFGFSIRSGEIISTGMNEPFHMTDQECVDAADRLAEVGAILATGLVRLHARKSSQTRRPTGESSLDYTAWQSGDANGGMEKAE